MQSLTNAGRPPEGARFYRPELDVLRFVAFLLVFCRHVFQVRSPVWNPLLRAGRAGVCVFFLLSSYLITTLLQREFARTHTIRLRAFYIRRILRIWPLYFLMLLISRLIDSQPPHLQMSNGRLLASVLLAGNWYACFFGLSASVGAVLWTISVEEQFYLFWPGIRKHLGERVLLWLSVATVPISYLVIAMLADGHHTDDQVWVNTFVQMQFFGVGALLALLLGDRSPRLPTPLRAVIFSLAIAVLYCGQYFFHRNSEVPTRQSAIPEYLFMLVGSTLLFLSLLGLAQLSRAQFLVYLGKISYGLYVFHFLALRIALRPALWLQHHEAWSEGAMKVLQDGLGLVLTVIIATLSYRFFESYFLRWKERFATVRTRNV